MHDECFNCHQQTIDKLICKFRPDQDVAKSLRAALDLVFSKDEDLSNPQLAAFVHRLAKDKLNQQDLYKEEKSKANRMVYSQYYQWRSRILQSDDSFQMAAKLAVAGNVIDYGAHSVPDDIPSAIEQLVKKSLKIDQLSLLKKRLKSAKRVLYLGDNAGEIVFDKLFIDLIKHDNITFVTRGEAVINDATIEDAQQIGMQDLCSLMPNGSDAPSTLLNECSPAFIQAYKEADLIIAKGMGNFEGLMDESDPRIFFMLMAKCKPIADLLGVTKGDMLVTQFLTKKENAI